MIKKRVVPLVQAMVRKVTRPAGTTTNARLTQLERLPCPPGRVLFLGDSITEHGEWSEWFPELSCLNRGVGGDSVDGVRRRVRWTVNSPTAISLLIGTNDLGGAGLTTRPSGIAEQMRMLCDELRAAAPDARLVVNSVMPRDRLLRRSIQALNARYREIAAATFATYVDLWPVLADAEGRIRRDYSHDDLHLTGAGYEAWVALLRPHLVQP